MKGAFLLVSVLCAILMSLLIIGVLTGRVPFASPPPAPEAAPEAVKTPEAQVPNMVFTDSRGKTVDELIAALNAERESVAKRTTELAAKEEELKLKEEALTRLKTELQGLQAQLDGKIIEITDTERVNLKRLADMCSKMDSTSAGGFLKEMEKERAAIILSMISERSAAAIMDAVVGEGEKGAALVAEWADLIRRLESKKKAKTGA